MYTTSDNEKQIIVENDSLPELPSDNSLNNGSSNLNLPIDANNSSSSNVSKEVEQTLRFVTSIGESMNTKIITRTTTTNTTKKGLNFSLYMLVVFSGLLLLEAAFSRYEPLKQSMKHQPQQSIFLQNFLNQD